MIISRKNFSFSYITVYVWVFKKEKRGDRGGRGYLGMILRFITNHVLYYIANVSGQNIIIQYSLKVSSSPNNCLRDVTDWITYISISFIFLCVCVCACMIWQNVVIDLFFFLFFILSSVHSCTIYFSVWINAKFKPELLYF